MIIGLNRICRPFLWFSNSRAILGYHWRLVLSVLKESSLLVNVMKLNPCGHLCNGCPSYLSEGDPTCTGCTESGGRPWWGTCKVFECGARRKLDHCGLCNQFPCDLLATHYDPDNPEGQRNAMVRTGILAYRTKHGDDKALELFRKIRKV